MDGTEWDSGAVAEVSGVSGRLLCDCGWGRGVGDDCDVCSLGACHPMRSFAGISCGEPEAADPRAVSQFAQELKGCGGIGRAPKDRPRR